MAFGFGRFGGWFHAFQVLHDGPDHGDHGIANGQEALSESIFGQAIPGKFAG